MNVFILSASEYNWDGARAHAVVGLPGNARGPARGSPEDGGREMRTTSTPSCSGLSSETTRRSHDLTVGAA
jgi:hypothetical protein